MDNAASHILLVEVSEQGGLKVIKLSNTTLALGHKCNSNSDIEPPCRQVEEMLTDEEIVDHVQHMRYEEMDV